MELENSNKIKKTKCVNCKKYKKCGAFKNRKTEEELFFCRKCIIEFKVEK